MPQESITKMIYLIYLQFINTECRNVTMLKILSENKLCFMHYMSSVSAGDNSIENC